MKVGTMELRIIKISQFWPASDDFLQKMINEIDLSNESTSRTEISPSSIHQTNWCWKLLECSSSCIANHSSDLFQVGSSNLYSVLKELKPIDDTGPNYYSRKVYYNIISYYNSRKDYNSRFFSTFGRVDFLGLPQSTF